MKSTWLVYLIECSDGSLSVYGDYRRSGVALPGPCAGPGRALYASAPSAAHAGGGRASGSIFGLESRVPNQAADGGREARLCRSDVRGTRRARRCLRRQACGRLGNASTAHKTAKTKEKATFLAAGGLLLAYSYRGAGISRNSPPHRRPNRSRNRPCGSPCSCRIRRTASPASP